MGGGGGGGPRTNTKVWSSHKMDCVRGVWGLLKLFFVHSHSTYIPASCRLRLAVSDRKVRRTGS